MSNLRLIPLLGLFLLLVTLVQSVWAETGGLERADGSIITYYLDRPSQQNFPLVAILQGSECLRVSDKYGPFISQLNDAGVGVLRVEKPGLNASVEIGQCPEEYLRLNTPQRRVLDLVAVIAALRREEPAWNGKLGLLGGSEGSMVAAMTAPLLSEVGAVVLISSGGGLPFGQEMRLGMKAQMLAEGLDPKIVDEQVEEAKLAHQRSRDDPSWKKEWGSDGKLVRNTYLWWASAIPLQLARPLKQVACPVLVVYGRSDHGIPAESTRKLQETLRAEGKTNFEFRAYEGGHSPPLEEVSASLEWMIQRL